MRFLGKCLEAPYLFKGDGFLRVIQREDNDCMVVPKKDFMYKCPYDLPLQAVHAAVNLLQFVNLVGFFT